ncbi:uncharacterized protein B0I36DRAFT_426310 [Microdochium trichocladiopsis]|uniref:Cytochrome P450 n=1 Tax=Microdochium trichocladiopsis TaxID=1682393 RepID=A0A9P8YGP0_9PEZI|nr:uncharacterized protein B0I36DRAFT_426310 [Microdochium trichocladiopsis]KAH7039667.1 hypothetical protein B0I36DRAFT_426310 [Microdochium trichocladiopsis]
MAGLLSWALQLVATASLSFFASLFTSTLLYRTFFHPLRRFIGPSGAKYTQFWLAAQYGEYVRVRPNMLSISDPDMVESIHGTHTTFEKDEWYDIGISMAEHAHRWGHGWDKAVAPKPLRAYDSRLLKYSDILVEQLSHRSGEVVNLTEWTKWWSFDSMGTRNISQTGDPAFGRPFDTLEKAQSHSYLDTVHMTGLVAGVLGSLPRLLHMSVALVSLPLTPIRPAGRLRAPVRRGAQAEEGAFRTR